MEKWVYLDLNQGGEEFGLGMAGTEQGESHVWGWFDLADESSIPRWACMIRAQGVFNRKL